MLIHVSTETLVENLVTEQKEMTDRQRVLLWRKLQDGYCKECGTPNPDCKCWNDE